jgi:hypothetical protein
MTDRNKRADKQTNKQKCLLCIQEKIAEEERK